MEPPINPVDTLYMRQLLNVDATTSNQSPATPGTGHAYVLLGMDFVGSPTAGAASLAVKSTATGARFFFFGTSTAANDQYLSWRGYQLFPSGDSFEVIPAEGTWDMLCFGLIVPYHP